MSDHSRKSSTPRCLALIFGCAILLALAMPAGTAASSRAQPYVSTFVEPQTGDGPVLNLIGRARHLIRLELYELTDADIVNALASAKHRHVSVEVLLEQHPFGGGSYAQAAYHELQSRGIAVRWANENAFTFTHEKALDIDNQIAGIFTFNMSYSAFSSNREFGVIDYSHRDAWEIGSIFQADWNRSKAKLSDPNLVVSPINSRSSITHLIDGAHHTLDLYEEEMDDGTVESHLIGAVRRHVRVRVIISSDSSGVENIKAGGVRVVIMSSPYVHAKAVVADGARVFIGSENISTTSLDSNRELGIILSQKSAIRTVENSFQSDWQANGGWTPPHHGGKLTLSVSTNPRSVRRGNLLTITASTTSSAVCTIKVTYPDGYVSHASALQGPRTADSGGHVNWPGMSAAPSTARPTPP